MNEMLSVDEIKARYPDEFVIVGYPDSLERYSDVKPERGIVVSHGPVQDAVFREAKSSSYQHLAAFYTGEPNPDGRVYVL